MFLLSRELSFFSLPFSSDDSAFPISSRILLSYEKSCHYNRTSARAHWGKSRYQGIYLSIFISFPFLLRLPEHEQNVVLGYYYIIITTKNLPVQKSTKPYVPVGVRAEPLGTGKHNSAGLPLHTFLIVAYDASLLFSISTFYIHPSIYYLSYPAPLPHTFTLFYLSLPPPHPPLQNVACNTTYLQQEKKNNK